jgi:putative hydrolase of the HAD superfamily
MNTPVNAASRAASSFQHPSSSRRGITLVGFDADDTLWHSEGYYQAAHAEFERILSRYLDLADAALHQRLLDTERRNIALFGYGAKGMTLSMIETAISMTQARIDSADIGKLVELGKGVLAHPVELLPDVRAAVESVAVSHRIVLITKGDLFHQEAKIAASGLAHLFTRIEIVSDKTPAAYARVIAECGETPERFAMIGNSLRSDIEPVLTLGGWGVHLPYPLLWALEAEHGVEDDHARVLRIESAAQIPQALAQLDALSAA